MARLPRDQRGFTLLELLTVILIMAMLATNLTTYFRRAAIETNDSLRLANIRVIIQALQIYYQNTGHWPYAIEANYNSPSCINEPLPTRSPCTYASGPGTVTCESRRKCLCPNVKGQPNFQQWLPLGKAANGSWTETLGDYFVTGATPSDPTERGNYCPGTVDLSQLKRYYSYIVGIPGGVSEGTFRLLYYLDSYRGPTNQLGYNTDASGSACAKSPNGCLYIVFGLPDGTIKTSL